MLAASNAAAIGFVGCWNARAREGGTRMRWLVLAIMAGIVYFRQKEAHLLTGRIW